MNSYFYVSTKNERNKLGVNEIHEVMFDQRTLHVRSTFDSNKKIAQKCFINITKPLSSDYSIKVDKNIKQTSSLQKNAFFLAFDDLMFISAVTHLNYIPYMYVSCHINDILEGKRKEIFLTYFFFIMSDTYMPMCYTYNCHYRRVLLV